MKKVIIGFIALFSISACNNNNEWSKFRGNLGNTGHYEGKAPVELTNIKWKFKTEGDIDSIVSIAKFNSKGLVSKLKKTKKNEYSSPTVADGIVFFGSTDNYLYAIDVKTGQKKWKFKTEDDIYSSPAVKEGIVFFWK